MTRKAAGAIEPRQARGLSRPDLKTVRDLLMVAIDLSDFSFT